MKTIGALLACMSFTVAMQSSAQSVHVVTEQTSFSYIKDGKVAGPATDFVEKTLKQAGFTDYKIDLYPWARAYDVAQHEPNALIYLIARTPQREAQFKWVGEYNRIQYYFYRLRERNDIVVNQLNDAKKYVVGVIRDDIRDQYLRGQSFTRLVVTGQPIENFNQLVRRQVDLVPLAENDAMLFCVENRVDCERLVKAYPLDAINVGLYLAFSLPTSDAIVQRMVEAFRIVDADRRRSRRN